MTYPPSRIVCLSAETAETLYLLGEQDRVVGVTGFAVRPPRIRREKPRVSGFTTADLPRILALDPDLVLTFSDLQADIVADLIRNGVAVHAFNQRTIAGILAMIQTLGALVGCSERATTLAHSLEKRIDTIRSAAVGWTSLPRVYFEEWDEPTVCGIQWVSELITVAGGVDVFAERALAPGARARVVQPEEVIAASPDLIIASWCGKKFIPRRLAERPGFDAIPAVCENALFEINSTIVLQPGPAALTDGLERLHAIVKAWHLRQAHGRGETTDAV
ncbi:cobalamin-binding protein [Microvirga antarctica]|uniref:cobalamin-binding protein n=1 Tax=Microvirga antarctica TaxID=2819233 RepID=UPI001B30328B|nr:cobalamin-binding protein [Microvirga antarctica]